eukprot:GHVR01104248.1.p4 GENE.GHVR01104248.1~~GHVR01104248.1.p4  ORF type:complete len:111 (-),score=12.75 GHVR01104248.1:485-817(-)
MAARPDGKIDIAAAFARVKTPRANKRPRSEQNSQDLVTPKPPPSSKKDEAPHEEVALEKKDAKQMRKPELQQQRLAARSREKKHADSGEPTTKACGAIEGGEGRRPSARH